MHVSVLSLIWYIVIYDIRYVCIHVCMYNKIVIILHNIYTHTLYEYNQGLRKIRGKEGSDRYMRCIHVYICVYISE